MQVRTADGFKVCSVPSKRGKECVLRLRDTRSQLLAARPGRWRKSIIYVPCLSPAFPGMPFEVCWYVFVSTFVSVTVDCG